MNYKQRPKQRQQRADAASPTNRPRQRRRRPKQLWRFGQGVALTPGAIARWDKPSAETLMGHVRQVQRGSFGVNSAALEGTELRLQIDNCLQGQGGNASVRYRDTVGGDIDWLIQMTFTVVDLGAVEGSEARGTHTGRSGGGASAGSSQSTARTNSLEATRSAEVSSSPPGSSGGIGATGGGSGTVGASETETSASSSDVSTQHHTALTREVDTAGRSALVLANVLVQAEIPDVEMGSLWNPLETGHRLRGTLDREVGGVQPRTVRRAFKAGIIHSYEDTIGRE